MEVAAFVVALVGQEVATEPVPLPWPCLLISVSCTNGKYLSNSWALQITLYQTMMKCMEVTARSMCLKACVADLTNLFQPVLEQH